MFIPGLCPSQLKSSWLTLKGDGDVRAKSPDQDTQSLPQSPGMDRELQRLHESANSTYPREYALIFLAEVLRNHEVIRMLCVLGSEEGGSSLLPKAWLLIFHFFYSIEDLLLFPFTLQ